MPELSKARHESGFERCAHARGVMRRGRGTHKERRERSEERSSAGVAGGSAQARPSRDGHVRRAALRQRLEVHAADVGAALSRHRLRGGNGCASKPRHRSKQLTKRWAPHGGRARRSRACSASRGGRGRDERKERRCSVWHAGLVALSRARAVRPAVPKRRRVPPRGVTISEKAKASRVSRGSTLLLSRDADVVLGCVACVRCFTSRPSTAAPAMRPCCAPAAAGTFAGSVSTFPA